MTLQQVGKIGFFTAVSLVIANMVGTGVFGSLGFQLLGIQNGAAIMALWVVGGIAAFCGALAYAELGSMYPRSGGEYNFLSRIYHPAFGFLSGWISVTVGFAAPIAAAAVLLGGYAHTFLPFSPKVIAAGVVLVITAVHLFQIRVGGAFQSFFTVGKILFIVFFIAVGLLSGKANGDATFGLTPDFWTSITSASFATSLFFVSYAYSGWNASTYLAGEIKDPKKNLPRSLFVGTILVTILYLALNYVFLHVAPIADLKVFFTNNGPQNTETGHVAAKVLFGENGGRIMSGVIALLLVSTISAMVMAGPRVTQMIGEDFKMLGFFAQKTKSGIPAIAILTQTVIALVLIFTASFDKIITYTAFTLNLFTFLTVLGVMVMRFREPKMERPFKMWGYPVTPVLFLALGLWLLYFGLKDKPLESLLGLGTVVLGLIVYFFIRSKRNSPNV